MGWLADDFIHPERLDLPTGHHLRPIRESDTDLERALDELVPRWLAERWGFRAVDYVP
jgi:hypothetical protein